MSWLSDPVSAGVSAVLAIWLVLSAFNQVDRIGRRLSRFDPFGLLPRWTFFAPNPGVNDHHLVCRTAETLPSEEEPAAESFGDWHQVGPEPGSGIPLLWNPLRRPGKTLSDMLNGLARMHADADLQKFVHFSTEYLWLTHMAMRGVAPGRYFQWAVVRTHGFAGRRRMSLVIVSRPHRAA